MGRSFRPKCCRELIRLRPRCLSSTACRATSSSASPSSSPNGCWVGRLASCFAARSRSRAAISFARCSLSFDACSTLAFLSDAHLAAFNAASSAESFCGDFRLLWPSLFGTAGERFGVTGFPPPDCTFLPIACLPVLADQVLYYMPCSQFPML
jgi:hypothetical protein